MNGKKLFRIFFKFFDRRTHGNSELRDVGHLTDNMEIRMILSNYQIRECLPLHSCRAIRSPPLYT